MISDSWHCTVTLLSKAVLVLIEVVPEFSLIDFFSLQKQKIGFEAPAFQKSLDQTLTVSSGKTLRF